MNKNELNLIKRRIFHNFKNRLNGMKQIFYEYEKYRRILYIPCEIMIGNSGKIA